MTERVNRISHAPNTMGTITKSAVSQVSFPAGSNTGSPVTLLRNSKQLQRLSASSGFGRVHLIAFGGLLAVLLAVFLVLPNMVTPPDPESLAKPQLEAPKAETPPDSPWQDAQLAKQRRQAQEILSQILTIQNQLEEKKVELWAKDDFVKAMETAAAGDTEYKAREFDKAQHNYRDSLSQFQALQAQVEPQFQQRMASGAKAIEENEPVTALNSYQLALYLKPESLDAQHGLKRAEALENVMALVSEGKHLMKTQKFTQAKEKFAQALVFDKDSVMAKEQLAKSKQAIRDDNFATAMSNGYGAISQNEYQKAITAFKQALKIRPGAEDATQALAQAQNKSLMASVSSLNQQAQSFERQEKWHDALAKYQKMLALDKSLIEAKVGAIRAGARAKLDDNLQNALTQPKRLTSPSVFAGAQQTLSDARKIKKPGNRLKTQIASLNRLMAQLQKPVAVTIKSNNQTNITLYKVGNLGSFDAKTMDLKPGKYTIVGTREGFRDVRREITLMPSAQVTEIVVQCDEKITNG